MKGLDGGSPPGLRGERGCWNPRLCRWQHPATHLTLFQSSPPDSSLRDWPLCSHAIALTYLFSPSSFSTEPNSITKLSPNFLTLMLLDPTSMWLQVEQNSSYIQVGTIRVHFCWKLLSATQMPGAEGIATDTELPEDRCRYIKRKTIISQKTCSCNLHPTGRRANSVKSPP